MKRILLLLLFVNLSTLGFAQSSGITYQAVIYGPSGQQLPGANNQQYILANKTICLRFSIIDQQTQTEYQETITTTTDKFGMVNLLIGTGTQVSGYAAGFIGIAWDVNTKSLKVELDPSQSCQNFTQISNNPFTYVPFAFFSANSGESGPQGIEGISAYQIWLNEGNTGTESDFITSLQGSQGIAGTNGIDGINGATGAQGIAGTNGIDGINGATGSQGIAGTNGIDGINGATGPTGLQGATGSTGATGSQGIAGTNGTNGINGATGTQGPIGLTGATGPQGIQGPSGVSSLTMNIELTSKRNILQNINDYNIGDIVFDTQENKLKLLTYQQHVLPSPLITQTSSQTTMVTHINYVFSFKLNTPLVLSSLLKPTVYAGTAYPSRLYYDLDDDISNGLGIVISPYLTNTSAASLNSILEPNITYRVQFQYYFSNMGSQNTQFYVYDTNAFSFDTSVFQEVIWHQSNYLTSTSYSISTQTPNIIDNVLFNGISSTEKNWIKLN